jgi:transcriptional regulator with XRE-family HTH domain
MMKQPELGQKILELRQQKGLTQEELVAQCNISVRTIQRIEAGETMPRVYTIKTILSALDRDLDDLQEDTIFEAKVKKAMLFEIDESKDVSYLFKQLHIGWVAGILSMIVFIFQIFDTYHYETENVYFAGDTGFRLLALFAIVFFIFHMRAFILIGNLFKASILKAAALVFITVEIIANLITIIDVHGTYISDIAYGIITSVLYGVAFLVFGYALYKLKGLGALSQGTGIGYIILGVFFCTIILAIVALPLSIVAQVFNILIILKAIDMIKRQVG